MREQRMWTEEETATMLQMRADNEKIDYIAYKLKRTPASIASKLKNMDELSHYKKWTDEEWQLAIELQKQGLSYRQIGKVLGRKFTTVRGKFQTMHRKEGIHGEIRISEKDNKPLRTLTDQGRNKKVCFSL